MATLKVFTVLFLLFIAGEVQPHVQQRESTKQQKLQSLKKTSEIDNLLSSDTIPSLLFQPPPPPPAFSPLASNSINQFQWWNNQDSSGSGWFGFNHFIPRGARAMPFGGNNRLRANFLMGEATQMYPMMNPNNPMMNPNNPMMNPNNPMMNPNNPMMNPNNPPPLHLMTHMDNSFMMNRHVTPINPNFLGNLPQFLMQFQAPMRTQNDFSSAPSNRPQSNNFNRNHNRNHQRHHPSDNMQRMQTVPMPVTIKIVPLKLTSRDIAEALKSMSWVPIPLDLINVNPADDKKSGDNRSYDDAKDRFGTIMLIQNQQEEDEEEQNLPPPSSHVATPLDKPYGVTYADEQISERYDQMYHPRR